MARGTWIFPVRPSMRLIADSILYANDVRRASTRSRSPARMCATPARTAVEEMAYTLANGLAYVDELIRRGGDVAKFAKRLSFFFYVHMDFFEEVVQVPRRPAPMGEAAAANATASPTTRRCMFRFGVVCGGSSLVAAQPYNNIMRVAIETMAAVLGGAQSIFTCAYDEAFQIPTEFSAEIACARSRSCAYESGIAEPRSIHSAAVISSNGSPTGWSRKCSR